MKRKKDEIEEVEEKEEVEEDPKALKKKQREEKKEKRLKKKKQDKAARWAGAIMLFLIMIVGFLLWVSGQIGSDNRQDYARPVVTPNSTIQTPMRGGSVPSQTGKVIVK